MDQKSIEFLWKIGAPAGLGVMTTGLTMSKLSLRSGMYVYDYAEYPSLIKGGHNTYECCMSTRPVTNTKLGIDCLVCFNAETAALHSHRLTDQSLVLFDPAQFSLTTPGIQIPVPMQELMNELQADKVMINMVALGASCAILGGTLDLLQTLIREQFSNKKGTEVADKNCACAAAGFTYVTKKFPQHIATVLSTSVTQEDHIALAGNEAFALGAVGADCKLYAAYPMSPSSSVLTTLAAWQKETGMVVRHAEDEIGVINEALGASFMGVRAATGTSGGGFALMVETLSYAGVAELPLVVFVAQRPGPATGMPTWTEQGDLLFACFAGHGEFPKIVLAPGGPEEMVAQTKRAFDLADIYQLPVIILSDKNLSESHYSVSTARLAELMSTPNDRGKLLTQADAAYLRYAPSADGISPRILPGTAGTHFQANSYEHLPDGHTSEDAEVRIQQVNKRDQKIKTYLSQHFQMPTQYGDAAASDTVLISWGGTKGAVLEAQRILAAQGLPMEYLHFSSVYPLHAELLQPILNQPKKYIVIENNMTKQFAQLLRMATGFVPTNTITRYDGHPFIGEELAAEIRALSAT